MFKYKWMARDILNVWNVARDLFFCFVFWNFYDFSEKPHTEFHFIWIPIPLYDEYFFTIFFSLALVCTKAMQKLCWNRLWYFVGRTVCVCVCCACVVLNSLRTRAVPVLLLLIFSLFCTQTTSHSTHYGYCSKVTNDEMPLRFPVESK